MCKKELRDNLDLLVFIDTDEDLIRQKKFWEIFRNSTNFSKYHGWIHPESKVCSTWLKNKGKKFLS